MHDAVPVIIIAIVCIQIYFFVKNFLRMRQFGNIFSEQNSWRVRKDASSDMVDGMHGNGNGIFMAIVDSINKYLGYNTGSVIDFDLLKDAVDRHCDSVENDIATQTPIPLYWGLAGTMAGVIIGLWDLLSQDTIMTLLGGSGGSEIITTQNAADGVNALLSGVAWAMLASICGIILTTLNSLLFKSYKLKQEGGKNSFLAWMQSVLLPELPSDTSEALGKLVQNLNRFNNMFAENTSHLGNVLNAVNESYGIQADIIKAVHDMDVMKMAKANVRVLEELLQCTDKLEMFNRYLDDIEGYTEAIHRFELLFKEEADRVHVLEEIRDYFGRHKGEIAKTTADADNAIRQSLDVIKESTAANMDEMHVRFMEQCEAFKDILKEEQEAFKKFQLELQITFSERMAQMPSIAERLEKIADIPVCLDKLMERIDKSNVHLAADISQSVRRALVESKEDRHFLEVNSFQQANDGNMPGWMKYSGWAALIVIALAGVANITVIVIDWWS